MTGFDYAVLAIVGVSVLLSIMRGFVREVLALISWVVAFIVARLYALELVPLLPEAIPNEELKMLAAFLIVFLTTLLLCSLLAIALSHIFKKVGLGWIDRGLGAVFGVLRGVLVVCILVLLAGFTGLPRDPMWRNAMFAAPLEAVVLAQLSWLPADIAKHVKYD
ncbi:MAG: colicin V production protein [Betaproteobacteria bacterium HGW-Betaproteobacteria-2]|jgi:membrane protein required for colicin V production|nr:MAG: colicin V production protein [Betaproteobacteria bacterium HGW-Betaproteobacteria-2]